MWRWIFVAAVTWWFSGQVSGLAQEDVVVSKIAFGSCANQNKPCPIWDVIADYRPQVTALLGDNIYADYIGGRSEPATPGRISAAYQRLLSVPGFARLKDSTRLLATWDDHDYGDNDAGREWIHKEASAVRRHDFLGAPPDSPRRLQEAVYDAQAFGPPGRLIRKCEASGVVILSGDRHLGEISYDLDAVFSGENSHANLQTFLHQTNRAIGKVTLYNGRKQVDILRAADIEVVPR